jgi:uncharacterized protein
MPLVKSQFIPNFLFKNGHLQTLIPALFRKTDCTRYTRERINTPDDDFLDLDWIHTGSDQLVVICHGLEGSSHSTSVAGMANFLSKNGFDVLVLNFRSCSGEMNRQLRFYHSGETGDLDLAIKHAVETGTYKNIYLLGFSLGANVVLKYIGEKAESLLPAIRKAVVFSVPCDLEASAFYMNRRSARIYLNNFLRSLKSKIILKNRLIPGALNIESIDKIRTFHDFDGQFTGPIHGFKDAHDYYSKSSSIRFLPNIKIPALIINAGNDPFLPPQCYPVEIARHHPFVFLEIPQSGGHVGFFQNKTNGIYWSEQRALEFILE